MIPFYSGDDESVIPVYESSYQFQFCTSAGKTIKYWSRLFCVIADDLILNPSLNENNFLEELQILKGECLITEAAPMRHHQWPNVKTAMLSKR